MTISAANPERTNRWLLIGAAVLALIAGLAVALALSNADSGGSNSSTKQSSGGDVKVLVAKETIASNTTISAGMFTVASVAKSALVIPNPVADEGAVIGKVTRSDILKGEQLSFDRLGAGDKLDPSLAPKIPDGSVGFTVSVDETGSVAGLLVPGDHVDVIFIVKENRGGAADVTRVETVLQNLTVLAFAQEAVASSPLKDAQGTPIVATAVAGDVRREDLKPNPGARTVTLALTPQQVQTMAGLQDTGKLQLALRRLGDGSDHVVAPTFLNTLGFLPPTPRP
jgi:pilus assembly protein CpaB